MRLEKGVNDLATINPGLAAQAYGWDPTTVTKSSGREVKWRCELGHTWPATVADRSRGNGCPYCSNQKVLVGYNDLAITSPELAAQAHDFDPTTVTKSSNKKVGWQCHLGHTWPATVNNRSNGNGCPYCSKRKATVGVNDLATLNPELAAQAHDFDPTTVTASSNKKVIWQCHLGHTWPAKVKDRSGGDGCPYCSKRKATVGVNDLATTNPDLAKEAHDFDPTTVTKFSNKKVGWRCQIGHDWRAIVANRSKGSNCPYCAEHGFNLSKQGQIYLLEHQELDLYQIGISNQVAVRLAIHARSGWKILEVSESMPGHETRSYEQDALRLLRRLGARFASDIGIAKFDGYTEAWTRESFRLESLSELFAMVDEDRSEARAA